MTDKLPEHLSLVNKCRVSNGQAPGPASTLFVEIHSISGPKESLFPEI